MPFKEVQERITELERKVGNMLFYAVVLEAKENKVRVAQGDLITGWIPVFQPAAGSNVNIFMPIKKDEEVCVLCPNGSIENGIAIRGLNYKKNGHDVPTEASGDDTIVLKSNHKIQILVEGDAEIKAKNAKIEAETTATVKAASAKIDAGNVEITGICKVQGETFGVLTSKILCPITGAPVDPVGSTVLRVQS